MAVKRDGTRATECDLAGRAKPFLVICEAALALVPARHERFDRKVAREGHPSA